MLTVLVIFLVLLILLLAIPVSLTFKMSWKQILQSEITLTWAFGLVRVQLPSLQSSPHSSQGEQQTNRNKHSPDMKTNYFGIIWNKSFRQRVIKFMRDCWHAIRKQDLSLRIRAGLGDPADTGQLWSIVGPVAGILSNNKQASIDIAPDFFEATLELDSHGNIQLIPLQIIYLTLGLLLSPAIWQGFKQMRNTR